MRAALSSRFPFVMAAALLALVLIAFSPTFDLKA